jgi:DNA polymerase-3 subunit beta
MNFTCEKSLLLAAVNTAARATAVKSPIPALEGILVEAGMTNVRLTGYDLKKGIYTTFDADVKEPGNVVLGARIFGDIVRSLPDGMVNVKTTDGLNVTISCGKSEFSIIGSDHNDYPELPSVDSQTGVSLPQSILGEMIRQTIFAVSDNEARPIYTGELFELGGGQLTVVAVDGYRLALRREKVEGIEGDYSFIVPGKALSDLEKLCTDPDGSVRITLGSKHISFTIGGTVLISRRLDGEFLNYRKAVPQSFAINVDCERSAFQRAVERVSLIIDDKVKNPVRCTFSDDCVKMVCATSLGKAEDTCVVDGSGNDTEIGFNNRYLLDALKAAPSGELKISLNTGSSPCVICPADGSDGFLYMILPVRLKAD